MSIYDLHQAKPGFHGRHIFLSFRLVVRSCATATIKPHRDATEEVATIFLPTEKAEALREACAAFNAVMDKVRDVALVEDADEAEAA